MLRTPFSLSVLMPEDVALLFRVVDRTQQPGDTLVDRETRATAALYLFQAGVCDEEELIKALARRGLASGSQATKGATKPAAQWTKPGLSAR